jgi:hypothetical protein
MGLPEEEVRAEEGEVAYGNSMMYLRATTRS